MPDGKHGDATVWNRVPVWSWADVVASERLFGSVAMSTELVLVPGRADV